MTALPAGAESPNRFDEQLGRHGLGLPRREPGVLQLNVGRLCNQTCRHCHVSAGPTRTELMTEPVADAAIRLLDALPSVHTLDITGGAPEMAPVFRSLVLAGRSRGKRVIDRCNLTILLEPGYEDLAPFLAANRVDIIASLPCYTVGNVDKQRGDGVFGRSIEALRRLNALGYGAHEGNSTPRLDLVYNPGGPSLPPSQATLEADYRLRLRDDFGVRFDHLLCLTNLPIGRFASDLRRQGKLEAYIDLLDEAFNPATVEGLMCRDTLSVGYDGSLYDCDFNQMLGIPLGGGGRRSILDADPAELTRLPIATGDHCLGCTAGCGSSCGGELADPACR
ncbi:MAG: hypothetical protein PWP23_3158 [Candidatus Sumerlaeota bacterium]|nr:hypothetical protein [Candidatus Sumerlaeota bacterium]